MPGFSLAEIIIVMLVHGDDDLACSRSLASDANLNALLEPARLLN